MIPGNQFFYIQNLHTYLAALSSHHRLSPIAGIISMETKFIDDSVNRSIILPYLLPYPQGQCRRQPGALKSHSLDGFLPARGRPRPSNPFFFFAMQNRPYMSLFFLAEKEGFEPSRQSPQPTPLAGEPLTATWVLLHGYIAGAMLNYLAEREGFEPPVPCGITGFQDQLHKPLGHLSIFKLYNYSKGFSHCQAGRFSKKWLKPFLRVFSDFASRVRSRAAKPAKYENLWFSSVLPHMSSKPE